MKKFIFLLIFHFLLLGTLVYAQEMGKTKLMDVAVNAFSDMTEEEMQAGVAKWTDEKMIKNFSGTPLTDDYVKKVYIRYKQVLVTPPEPGKYKVYEIKNGEESLKNVEYLGRELHNRLLAISDEDYKKYSQLIGMMCNVLNFDARHIPLAMKHDNSRDIYWHDLHNDWAQQVEREYSRLYPL